ncbi:MAG: hypothetical protein ABI824_16205 [Acidobacteriota bacterium]
MDPAADHRTVSSADTGVNAGPAGRNKCTKPPYQFDWFKPYLASIALRALDRYYQEHKMVRQFMSWLETNAFELIGDGLKVLGLIAAVWTVVWQLGKQHKNSLVQQRESARATLKLRIYEILLQRIRPVSDANLEAKGYAVRILLALESFQRETAAGYQPAPIKHRLPAFSDLHFKAQGQLAELIIEFECWSIAFPGLNVFKTALNAATYDVNQSFPLLFSALLHVLPMDPPPDESGKSTIVHPPPSPEVLSELRILIEKYNEAMEEIPYYIYDLTVEAQNNLLDGLFEGRVPPRPPLDPQCKVISTEAEQSQALIDYFENETPWGKNISAINARVMAGLKANAAGSDPK